MGTRCSSEFWASSHFDTQPAERSLGPSVSDCCLGPGPVQTGPFPTRALLIFPFPVCGVSWTCWIRESRLVSEGCFTSGKLLLTCIQVIPCPPTARARCGLYQLTLTLVPPSIPLAAPSCLGSVCCFSSVSSPTLCFWSFSVSGAEHSQFDSGFFCISAVLSSSVLGWLIRVRPRGRMFS